MKRALLALVLAACSTANTVSSIDGGADGPAGDSPIADGTASAQDATRYDGQGPEDAGTEVGGDAAGNDSGPAPGGDEAANDSGPAQGENCGAGAIAPTLLASGLAPSSRAYRTAVADASNVYFIRMGTSANNYADYAIQYAPKVGGSPITIFGPTTQINGLTVDATNVYFTTPGAVLRCASAGCGNAPSVVASLQVNPGPIVTSNGAVYYATDTQILSCPLSGCGSSPTVFANFGSGGVSLAADGTNLYWTQPTVPGDAASGGAVLSCPLGGCAGSPTVLAGGQGNPSWISSNGQDIFWLTDNALTKCAIVGCGNAPTLLASTTSASWTLVDDQYVYWTEGSALLQCPVTGCKLAPTQVAIGPNGGVIVASDARDLYLLTGQSGADTGDGTLQRCPVCGCDGAPVEESVIEDHQTADVVTDGTTVYWIDDGNLSNGQLIACAADDCVRTASVLYQGSSFGSVGGLMWNLVEYGQDLYFIQGQFRSNSSSLLARCPKAGCPGGATALQYAATSYSVGGTLSGLPGGTDIVLQDTSGDSITLSANGTFAFPTELQSGTTYDVNVLTQPSGHTCVISDDGSIFPSGSSGHARGTVGYGKVSSILVNCATNSFAVGGTVSGWLTGTVVLQNNGGDNLTINGEGNFGFGTTIANGVSYAVSVLTKPADETCVITNGSGVASGNVSNIAVTCTEGVQSGLTTDGNYLYWVTSGFVANGTFTNSAVMRMPIGGGAPVVLASGLLNVYMSSTALDKNYLYFSAYDDGTVNRVPLTGGAISPVATGQSDPTSLLLNGTTLYWATSSAIMSLNLGGDAGSPVSLAPAPGTNTNINYIASPRRLAIGGNFLYWVSMTDGTNAYNDSIGRVSLSGGTLSALVTTQFSLGGGIGIAGGRVFFTGSTPALMSVSE